MASVTVESAIDYSIYNSYMPVESCAQLFLTMFLSDQQV